MTDTANRIDVYSWRRLVNWFLTGFRSAAVIPLAILGCFWLFGEKPMIVFAAAIPVAWLVVALVVESRLRVRPRIDGTTGLSYSDDAEGWIQRHLNLTKKSSRDLAVIAVVVDDIDALEDRVGIPMHEVILAGLAGRIAEVVRQEDLLCRGSRSEFLICLGDVKPPATENLMHLAQRVQKLLDAPFHDGAVRVYCTVSIGITRAAQLSDPTPRALIRAAEATSFIAQDEGPGAVRVYKSEFGKKPRTDLDLADHIGDALENGEIVSWFQPQVSTDTGEITGFEALARWEHPERGLISPTTFLGLIERAGLSQRLAEVILTHALSAVRAWDHAGLGISTVAVNFASEELRNPRLADYLNWELDRHELGPDRLAIEVLENVIAHSDDDIIARNLRAIAEIGCRIDLDDFGTGYTSIMNIRRFSVSRIKIDRRLISRIDCDRDKRDLAAALLSMAECLGIETLGEGVETPSEHAMMAQLGCDQIQGYCVARPMPLGDTLTWASDYLARLPQLDPELLSVAKPEKPSAGT